MTSVKSHLPLSAGTATIRRKPVFTNPSPTASTTFRLLDKFPITSLGAVSSSPAPKSAQTQLSKTSKSEFSERRAVTYKPTRHHTHTLLPLYHPFGALALSVPDLDPTAFGLPAPVAMFDDPTRRSSNRTRRPAAKLRDADEATTPPLPPFIEVIPTPEAELKDKPSPRKRRLAGGGSGGGSKKKRKEPDDGDAMYPTKRSRNPRSSGMASAAAATRTPSGEEASPPASLGHSGASPAAEVGQGEPVEEKKPDRRTTRSRGALARRDSTASEATVTSVSASISATNGAAPRFAVSGDTMEIDGPTTNEATAPEGEPGKGDSETPIPQEQET
ncbi:hypothetical protein BS17DRAFT_809290 [Gyrodon lividus]|nr:hypothetical protein BS17DRAFT_809290 [Gyrodon lividus]